METFVRRRDSLSSLLWITAEADAKQQTFLSLVGPYSPITALALSGAVSTAIRGYLASVRSFDLDVILRVVLAQRNFEGANRAISSEGKGETIEHAIMSAIGEFIERWAGVVAPVCDGVGVARHSLQELEEASTPHLSPRELRTFADEQFETIGFPFVHVSGQDRITWTRGIRLRDMQDRLIPAVSAFLLSVAAPGEALLLSGSSNGLACGESWDTAVTSGLLELVERDALARAWFSQGSHFQLDCGESGASRVIELPTDVVGTNVAMATRNYPHLDRGSWMVGVGAGFGREAARNSAIRELGQCDRGFTAAQKFPQWEESGSILHLLEYFSAEKQQEQMTEFLDVIGYYGVPGRREIVEDWILQGIPNTGESVIEAPIGTSWRDVLSVNSWLDPFVVTLPMDGLPGPVEARPAVVRVICPQLVGVVPPPFAGLGHPRLYERRIQSADLQLLNYSQLNPEPLPLP